MKRPESEIDVMKLLRALNYKLSFERLRKCM